MDLSGPFIRRPVGTSLLAIGLLLAGAVAFKLLPIAPLPQVEFPTLQVQAKLPGADPATVASSVSAPLERRFAEIAGVNELTSTSILSRSFINLQFDLGRDIDGAARDVQAAINAASADLPADLTAPPSYWKVEPVRRANHDPGHVLGSPAAGRRLQLRRRHRGAAPQPGPGRGLHRRGRLGALGREGADRPGLSGGHGPRPGGRAGLHRQEQRQPAEGGAGRGGGVLHPARQRPARDRGRLHAADRLPEPRMPGCGWGTWAR